MPDILGPADAPFSKTARPDEGRNFSTLDTWFGDCSSPTAEDGTEIQSSWLNNIIAALRSLARSPGKLIDGLTPIVPEVGTDDALITKAILQLIQRGQPTYGVDTGTANHIVVSFNPAVVEYKEGLTVRAKVKFSSTGATDINVNGLGAIAVKHPDGTALAADDLVADGIAELVCDGAVFQLVASHTDNVGGGGGSYFFRVPYAVAGGTAAAITGTYAPATATPVAGDLFSIKLTADIPGPTTIAPDGHGPYDLVDAGNAALTLQFAKAGDLLLMEFDGAKFRILNKMASLGPSFMTPGAIGSLAVTVDGYFPPQFVSVYPNSFSPAPGYVYGNHIWDEQGYNFTLQGFGGFSGTWRILSCVPSGISGQNPALGGLMPWGPVFSLCQRIA